MPRSRRGEALILVLVFMVMILMVLMAFFSNSTLQQQVSKASSSEALSQIFAEGVADMTVADILQEVYAGSSVTQVVAGGVTNTLYLPLASSAAIPSLTAIPALTNTVSGTNVSLTNGLANLVKVSKAGLPVFPSASPYNFSLYPPANRASASSSTNTSMNWRSVPLQRWNTHLLIARANPSATNDTTPVSSFTTGTLAAVPDWILVARDWSNPTNWSTNMRWSRGGSSAVIGRYAYAVYDEGGLLDANVAGYPPVLGTVTNTAAFKAPATAFADLTVLGLTSNQVTQLVGWRNYASGSVSSYFPGYTFPDSGVAYAKSLLGVTNGFLQTSSSIGAAGTTDRQFVTRQQLIAFLSGVDATAVTNALNSLQYLGTFSRSLEQPSFAPATNRPLILPAANGGNNAYGYDTNINVSFLATRTPTNFTRTDGTLAAVGDPLVKKKFPLNRLAWLTYKGPSANRSQADPDIQSLISNGIPWSYLQQGTSSNIAKSFGLSWDSGNNRWKYNQHLGASGNGSSGAIKMLPAIAALSTPRDPDFFELLKATINVGSLGKSLLPGSTAMPADTGDPSATDQPYNYNYYLENSVDVQILRIGANIISQFQTANYPPRIVFDDGSGAVQMPTTVVGVANLPYLSRVITGAQLLQLPTVLPRSGGSTNNAVGSGFGGASWYVTNDLITTPGVGAAMQYPVVWNPHDPRSSSGAPGAGPTQFRVVADSTTPDQAESGTGQNGVIAYAYDGNAHYSYAATNSSPGYSWYGDASGTGNGLKQTITAAGTEIDFSAVSSTNRIFPEPAILFKPGTVTDSAGNVVTVAAGSANTIRGTIAGTNFYTSNLGLPDLVTYAGGITPPPYVGMFLGAFPLAWYYSSNAPVSVANAGFYVARYTGLGTPAGSYQSCYMTYRMQYKDPDGNWVTYDTKYGKTFNDYTQICVSTIKGGNGLNAICGNGRIGSDSHSGTGGFWTAPVDPRTSRFGLLWTGTYPASAGLNSPLSNLGGAYVNYYNIKPAPAYPNNHTTDNRPYFDRNGGWLDRANALLTTLRPDSGGGWFVMSGWPYSGFGGSASGKISTSSGTNNGWMAFVGEYTGAPGGGCYPALNPGALAQNNADAPSFFSETYALNSVNDGYSYSPQYFADPDGVVRRGMGAFISPGLPPSVTSAGFGTAYWPAKSSVGQPLALSLNYASGYAPAASLMLDPSLNLTAATSTAATSQMQSRPFMLHRPFYSVAELGYVFSDTPWRNLDMSTAESGASPLLDTFCIAESSDPGGLVAGRVNLNTRQVPVLQAVLSGGYFDASQPATSTNSTARIDTNTASLLAQALVMRASTNPLQNITDLVGRFVAKTAVRTLPATVITAQSIGLGRGALSSPGFSDGKLSYSGFSDAGWDTNALAPLSNSPAIDVYSAYQSSSVFTTSANFNGTKETISTIQRFREAPIRVLASGGQTRVWNLLIDLIAQTGRYPQSAGSLDNFMVEGEQHYWIHLAIDRLTGQVIDKQVEVVQE
jgi:hypothetical protein